LDEGTSKILLGRELVVGAVAQAQVIQRGAAASVRVFVMELDGGHGAAAHAALVDKRAATGVALPDLSPNGPGDVARART
jgi:hypothetical protein